MWQDDLDRLRSPDPEVRRKAIIALGRQKDPAALGPLAEVYRNDPDPGLRELAQKAGRYIRSSSAEAANEPPPASPPITTPDVSAPPAGRRVSGAAVERARGYFDRALDLQVRGQDAKAIEMLGKALEANPELTKDTMMINLAMDLTGRGSSAALAALENPDSRRELILRLSGIDPTTQSRHVNRLNEETVTWGSAFIDLSIYGLVNGAIVFVGSLVATQILFGMLSSAVATSPSGSTPEAIALLSRLNTQQITLPLAALYGLLSAVSAIIGLLIVDGAIHVVATTVLGGEGTLTGLIRKTTLYYTVVFAVSLVLNIVTTAVALGSDANTLSVLTWLPTVVSLLMAFWAAKLTGEAYNFGAAKGCVSMILGYVALVALAFCCVLTLTSALAPTLQSLSP